MDPTILLVIIIIIVVLIMLLVLGTGWCGGWYGRIER
jgi:hypothetical protein